MLGHTWLRVGASTSTFRCRNVLSLSDSVVRAGLQRAMRTANTPRQFATSTASDNPGSRLTELNRHTMREYPVWCCD